MFKSIFFRALFFKGWGWPGGGAIVSAAPKKWFPGMARHRSR